MNVLNSAPASTQLPVFKALTSGNATISQSGSQLTVTQTTNSASLNWSSFDIGSQAGVTFVQPGTSSIALNRILSGDGSVILGRLTANGQVILINPNGIVFGDGAQVNVGGLIASTLNISDTDFQNGTLVFQRGTATGSVTNAGSIVAAPGGYVALLAPHIANTGLIQANLGTVALASGDAVTLTLAGSGSLGVKVNPATVQSLIEAGGVIQAGGGKVLLTAQAANTLMGGAINATGVIEANSLTSQGGAIVLDGSGAVTLAGAKLDASGATGGGAITVGGWQTASVAVDAASTLDASAKISGNGGKISVIGGTNSFVGSAKATGGALGGDGGSIETSGHILNIDGAKVDAGAPKGKAGTWLLDPWDLTVDAAAAATIDGSLATTNVTLQTTATGASGPGIANASGVGDINIDSPLAWSANTTLTLDAYHSVNVNANIVGTNLNVLYNDGGTGGNLITGTGDSITLGGATPSLTINGSAYTLITTASQLQNAVNANLAGDYALDGNLDLTAVARGRRAGFPSPATPRPPISLSTRPRSATTAPSPSCRRRCEPRRTTRRSPRRSPTAPSTASPATTPLTTRNRKRVPFAQAAPGIIGLETLLALSLELHHKGEVSLIELLRRMTAAPAQFLGLPQGRLAKGAPADLLLFELDRHCHIEVGRFRSKSKNSPFDGRPVRGRVLRTIVDGRTVFAAGVSQ